MEFDIIKIKLDPHDIYDGKIIFLSFDGKPISPFEPIWWKEDNDSEKNGLHHQPAAFVINREKPDEIPLIATIRIQGKRPGKPREKYKLNGYWTLEETITYKVNWFRSKNDFKIPGNGNEIKPVTMDVPVVSRYHPGNFAGFSTFFSWEITPANDGCDPGKQEENRKSTYLELYWLYDAIDYSIFQYGVPVGILRYLTLLCRTFFLYTQSIQDFLFWLILVTGQEVPTLPPHISPDRDYKFPGYQKKEIIEYIVKACFFRNPPSYDIYHSRKHYVSFNGSNATFYLAEYLNAIHDTNAVCNCFDQAFALNIFLSAAGIANVKCCYIKPFGYLRLTELVGRGMCNNTKYKDPRHIKIVDPNTPGRSIFTKHACCRRDKIWILDSCAGPHTGNEDFDDYVKNTVDKAYSPTYVTKRTPGEIKEINGSISLDYNLAIEELAHDFYRVDEFKKIIGLDANKAEEEKKEEKYFVVCNWPDPRKCPVFRPKPYVWEVIFEKTTPGDQEVFKTWKLKKKGEHVTIKIYVSRQARYTFNRFLSLGSSSTLQDIPCERGPAYLGKLSAKSVHGDRGRHFWIPGYKGIKLNVAFEVTAINVTFEVKKLHKWLNKLARHHIKPSLDGYLPSVEDIIIRQYEPGSVSGGGPPDGDSLSKDVGIDDGPIMIEKGKRLMFLINTPDKIFLDFRYLKYETDEDKNGIGLRLIHKEDKCLEFIAFKESINKLRLVAVNNDTLLCNSKDFTIHVKSE